jgi:elongation factor Ts
VKQLREETGAGMMECKKALVEANGDLEEARTVLRKRGLASAAKKASRTAKQGLIHTWIEDGGKHAVLIEVNCESDFVARTDQFQALVTELAEHVAAAKPLNIDDLMAQPIHGQTVADYVSSKVATIGENIQLPRFERVKAVEGGVVGSYIHPGAQLGVLLEMTTGKPETGASEPLQELLRDLAMQVAAANPQFLSRADVTAEAIEREKEIHRARALAEGKPEKMVDKIIEGRMGKFYEEICLLEQPFIKENSVSVTKLLEDKGKELGDKLGVTRFFRYKVGETAPAEEAAAE